eukprot:gene8485-9352_t
MAGGIVLHLSKAISGLSVILEFVIAMAMELWRNFIAKQCIGMVRQ